MYTYINVKKAFLVVENFYSETICRSARAIIACLIKGEKGKTIKRRKRFKVVVRSTNVYENVANFFLCFLKDPFSDPSLFFK
jgi:hypothetical protein